MDMLAKPPHGSPCNGCGLCCISSLCPIATAHFGHRPAPCPAIMPQSNGTMLCGLMTDPARYAPDKVMKHGARAVSESVKMLNGSGDGCDARHDDEPEDSVFSLYVLLASGLDRVTEEGKAARKIWGL